MKTLKKMRLKKNRKEQYRIKWLLSQRARGEKNRKKRKRKKKEWKKKPDPELSSIGLIGLVPIKSFWMEKKKKKKAKLTVWS